ncbi:MAG: extracellular solute-binding protein [Candidatus Dormibacteraeota bacterium]|nr:extracellular solute-binding protein [Candidatus Dormibacteraeota bacterium]
MLKGIAGVSLASGPALLAACGGTSTSTTTPAKLGGSLKLGSNASDPAPKKGVDAVNAAFTKATTVTVTTNTVDHGTFQDQVNSYLQGTPDDVFTWFSGHRMRFFAANGLATPLDDVWDKVKGNFTAGFAASVKADDGHVYGIPTDYYPWAVFYRKSVFAAHNYQIPTTWDAFKALCAQMKKDGLVPLALGDKDGWPSQGWFDIINLRLNGYDFHTQLLTGKQKWTDPKVTKVFSTWAEVTPYYTPGLAGTKWQDAANTLVQKQAGMMLIGLFVSQQFTATGVQADIDDLDFFPFPDMGTQYDAEKAIDAPIDIVMVSKKSPSLSKNLTNAKAYMEFWAKGTTQLTWVTNAPGNLAAAKDTDTSGYSALNKKGVEIVSKANKITQYFDRDSRPDFAGPNGMQSFLLKYLSNPTGDQSGLQKQMQSFWDSLPPEA